MHKLRIPQFKRLGVFLASFFLSNPGKKPEGFF